MEHEVQKIIKEYQFMEHERQKIIKEYQFMEHERQKIIREYQFMEHERQKLSRNNSSWIHTIAATYHRKILELYKYEANEYGYEAKC